MPTSMTKPPWNFDWCIRFSDGKHIKLKERWFPRPLKLGGIGYRRFFAFHYGELNPASDPQGFPLKDSVNFPPIIRIDHDAWGPHLHYKGEDHIQQSRVRGFHISNADLFAFIEAVHRHRKGEEFDQILNFTVTP